MYLHRAQKVLPAKRYAKEEKWEYIEESCLTKTRSTSVCMTCHHFSHCCDRHSRTLLTCDVQQRLIPHGDHLTSRCPLWMPSQVRDDRWDSNAA